MKIAGNLTWNEELNNKVAKATTASKLVKRICREKGILIPPRLKIDIIRSLVGTHLMTGMDVIKVYS